MFIARCISLVAQWFGHLSLEPRLYYDASITRRTFSNLKIHLLLAITATLLLSACSGIFESSTTSTPTVTSAVGDVPLAQLHCPLNIKPVIVFRDEGAPPTATATPTATTATPGATTTATPGGTSTTTATVGATPTTLTDWDEVKANLGFTVYLPSALT